MTMSLPETWRFEASVLGARPSGSGSIVMAIKDSEWKIRRSGRPERSHGTSGKHGTRRDPQTYFWCGNTLRIEGVCMGTTIKASHSCINTDPRSQQ